MQSTFYTGNYGFLALGEPWIHTNRWQYAQAIESILNFANLPLSRNSSDALDVAHHLMNYVDLDANLLNLILSNSMDDRGWYILAYINSYDVLGRKDDLDTARRLFDYIWACAYDTLECKGRDSILPFFGGKKLINFPLCCPFVRGSLLGGLYDI